MRAGGRGLDNPNTPCNKLEMNHTGVEFQPINNKCSPYMREDFLLVG